MPARHQLTSSGSLRRTTASATIRTYVRTTVNPSASGEGQRGRDEVLTDLVGGDLTDGRDAGRGLGDQDAHASELEGPEPAGVESVRQQGGVLDPEVAGVDAGLQCGDQHGQAAG